MSELYRRNDRLSPKLVPTLADRECHVVGATDLLRSYSLISRSEPFQTNYFSENLVAPEIEPETVDL
jgi:hypothetical protein